MEKTFTRYISACNPPVGTGTGISLEGKQAWTEKTNTHTVILFPPKCGRFSKLTIPLHSNSYVLLTSKVSKLILELEDCQSFQFTCIAHLTLDLIL